MGATFVLSSQRGYPPSLPERRHSAAAAACRRKPPTGVALRRP